MNRADADGHGFDSPLEQDPQHPEGNYGASAGQVKANAQTFFTLASFIPGPIGRGAAVLNGLLSGALGNKAGGAIAVGMALLPGGGKLTKAEQMLKNVETGKAAEKAVEQTLQAQGSEILGKQVGVQTSLGLRRVDFLAKDAQGTLKNIEAKSLNADRTALQAAKDDEIATQGGKYVGKNTPQDMQGTTQTIPTEVKKPE